MVLHKGGFEMDPNIQMMLMLQNQAYMQPLAFMGQLRFGDQGAEASVGAAAADGVDESDLVSPKQGLKYSKMADILRGIKAKIDDKKKKAPGIDPNFADILNQGFRECYLPNDMEKGVTDYSSIENVPACVTPKLMPRPSRKIILFEIGTWDAMLTKKGYHSN